MKIRTGFVSNSSSSSFCGIGWRFTNKKEFADCVKDNISKEDYEKLLTNNFNVEDIVKDLFEYYSEDDVSTYWFYYPLYVKSLNKHIENIQYFKNVLMEKEIFKQIEKTQGEPEFLFETYYDG